MTGNTNQNTRSSSLISITLIGGATILLTLVLMAFSNLDSPQANGSTIPVRERLSLPVIIHLATVLPALPLGAYILWRKKGDALHKFLGRIWAALMFTTAVVSFWIGRPAGTGLFGTHFSFIHIFAIITIISIPMGVLLARKGLIEDHYKAMQGVYVGLIIAGLFSFIPGRIMGTLVLG